MKTVRQGGFTLMELVVVIAIIAILAAVALPRLIETQRDARAAKAKAIYGSLRSASSLARARCELDLAGTPTPGKVSCHDTPPMVEMDGHPVRIVHHFPAASADGIDVAADLNLAADGLVASNGTETNSLGISVAARTYTVSGGGTPQCSVTYLEAGLKGSSIIGAEVRVATDGC
ncbi:MAG: prepilin-type N-terminal cleavage/methylation domain-containing protein [Rhodocyclales bacterium]|nr:prepilin-type N-terminal cleavage/methylation domain-containing protein [Rhodocyclales bacterium]